MLKGFGRDAPDSSRTYTTAARNEQFLRASTIL